MRTYPHQEDKEEYSHAICIASSYGLERHRRADAQTVFDLMDQFRQAKAAPKFDEVLIFGNIDFWKDIEGQVIHDAYAKLVDLLKSKNTAGNFKDTNDGGGIYSLKIDNSILKATNIG
ncbi:hypothetical protein GCM10007094_29600 [Pseudovibrio japonicus]|uniref:Uncharacterized protein n=1 Tax=Pseudovibrio japonicus TaxID=366534 RepID=A0ABQ3EK07_9HYPH|nr:hypothetical protein [Pseudovibrio japonicus]GHB38294.1 hypothetical protein GCM10007094_29600 [Pseudovibrio japonicus]